MNNETVATLIAYCREKHRICPMPQKWNEMWEMLPEKKRKGAGWEPAPPPLILAAWHEAPGILKMARLQDHIKWADEHGDLEKISAFMRSLKEIDWFHIGD